MNDKLQAALVELTSQAMASGAAFFIEEASKGNVNPSASMDSAFGAYPTEFLRIRRDLTEPIANEVVSASDTTSEMPTTEQVRNAYAYVGQGYAPSERKSRVEAEAEFDRWLEDQRGFWREQASRSTYPLGSYNNGVFTPASGPMTDGTTDA